MKLFLCPNGYNEKQKEQALEGIAQLERQGHICALSVQNSISLYGNEDKAVFTAADCDLVVSIGGDGAVLRAAQVAISADKPLVGINSGRLGFLCVMTLAEVENFNTLFSSCRLSKRSLLEFKYGEEVHRALNDVVISKEDIGTTADLTVSVEGYTRYTMRTDGLVISTPTGSTAYNYSAGGPVLDPSCDSIAITPICALYGTIRTVVTDFKNAITVSERNDHALVISDGRTIGPITGELTVYRSEKQLALYMREKHSTIEAIIRRN